MSDRPLEFVSSARAELGDVAIVQGRLAAVLTINEGHRAVTFEFVGSEPCSECGAPDRITINEGCPNWHHDVRPVRTCGAGEPTSAPPEAAAASPPEHAGGRS